MAASLAPELRLLDGLFRLNRSILADLRIHISAAGELDLADFVALRSIESGTNSPGDLARELGLNPSVLSRTLTKLANAGLVRREVDAGDSRRSRVRLTAAGLRATTQLADHVRPHLAERLQRLQPDRIADFLECLTVLNE
ncbi:MarR family winged helix-turn-helix transcriptional regulator [Mycobacteroides abscessus]|uniref:MarR family winged helix-turn-helix transcriptional regulator n=1 Tax=Mycobacteroides abscessus TaxID=36809 RepID=UPI00189676A3